MDRLMDEYLNYNPDEDMNGPRGGAYGISLANRIHQRFGFDRCRLNISLKKLERSICEKDIHSK